MTQVVLENLDPIVIEKLKVRAQRHVESPRSTAWALFGSRTKGDLDTSSGHRG